MLTFLLTIIAAGLGAYLSTYLREKGKNLATKEDIGELTRIVEEIKNEHAKELELLKSHNQLRMAAIDKRMQAHQEAFALWRRLFRTADKPDEDGNLTKECVKECDKWWGDNCLYLEPDARVAFIDAFWAAVNRWPDNDKGSNWEKIESAGDVILYAVQLPGLSEGEKTHLKGIPSESWQTELSPATHAIGNSHAVTPPTPLP
jgi:hypothetical protein